jgi:hypothetical protein
MGRVERRRFPFPCATHARQRHSSSSGYLCLPRLLGAVAGATQDFLLGGWDEPATVILLLVDERRTVGVWNRG